MVVQNHVVVQGTQDVLATCARIHEGQRRVRLAVPDSKGELMDFLKNWAAISSLAGLLLYSTGRLFTDVFYGKYGLTPEDLGINVPYLVLRILPLAANSRWPSAWHRNVCSICSRCKRQTAC